MQREDKIGTAVIQTETWPTASPPIRYHGVLTRWIERNRGNQRGLGRLCK